MFDSELCLGFLLGFVTAGVVGFITQRLYLLRKKAGLANMKTAVVETKQSPKQIYRTSLRAQTEIMFWTFVLVLIVIAVVWVYLS